jgi:ABC-type Na+ transport system ATPase subunit NatA
MTSTRTRPAIRATGLRKSFGDKAVLDGIDLEVAEGTIFALLGPNGAGKTTTVHILSTLIGADAGEVSVAGHDLAREPDEVRAAIGVTGQLTAVDNLLTGEENLLLMAGLHHLGREEGRRRAAGLLDRFDLAEATRKPAATWSGGMRRRLDLAMGLIGAPRILFLDEPTTGLDGRARRPDRPAGPGPAGRRGHRRGAQAAHPRRPHPPPVRLSRRPRGGRPRPRRRDPRRRGPRPSGAQRRRRQVAAGTARPAR